MINPMFVIKDSAVSDHHAIVPTATMPTTDLLSLPSGERDVLFLIATRLLCAVGAKHSYEAVAVALNCAGHIFTVKGNTILSDGWKTIDSAFRASLKAKQGNDSTRADEAEDGASLPELIKNQLFPSVSAFIKEGKTSPPARYNDATLLSAMENAGAEDFPSAPPCKYVDH